MYYFHIIRDYSLKTSQKTRDVFLQGYQNDVKGSKGNALGFFQHLHKDKKLTVRETSTLVIGKIAKFWYKACIPMAIRTK